MIAKLIGILDSTGPEGLVVDVGGVGYLVFVSARTADRVGASGQPVTLFIDTHVREDHIHLYGFLDAGERAWFRLLLSVQGVGGRVALAILGVLSTDDLVTAIAAQDKALLTRADGVGAKLGGRIVAELKDKVGDVTLGRPAAGGRPSAAASGPLSDAVSALVNLGYGRADAFSAVNEAARKAGAEASAGVLIKAALRELAT